MFSLFSGGGGRGDDFWTGGGGGGRVKGGFGHLVGPVRVLTLLMHDDAPEHAFIQQVLDKGGYLFTTVHSVCNTYCCACSFSPPFFFNRHI